MPNFWYSNITSFISIGLHTRKLMRNAANLYETVNDGKNSYWSNINGDVLSINWLEMTDRIIDYVVSENWRVRNDLSNNGVELLEGAPTFIDPHTVAVSQKDGSEREVQAEDICIGDFANY